MNSILRNIPQQQSGDVLQQFARFMNANKGVPNPDAIIAQLVQTGRVSQEQLNAVQQQAGQIRGQFESVRANYGF